MEAKAKAHANIALIKYWGKSNIDLNLPAVGSISLTLKEIYTNTKVTFISELDHDHLILNGNIASREKTKRISHFLDIIRKRAGIKLYSKITSENNFPTGAGLASSASAFASLALAGSRAAGLDLNDIQLSELARLGSGSAARSVFGGFVEMKPGKKPDGSDAHAIQISDKNYWDLRLLIVITSEMEKETGSTEGMIRTEQTSPYYKEWIKSNKIDLQDCRNAISTRNFAKLGELAEFNCMKMHAVMMSARPGLVYWNATTLSLIHAIRGLRKQGVPAYFTIDAGPQVKVICLKEYVDSIQTELKKIEGVKHLIKTSIGPGVSLQKEYK
jgi:diphosphomevalonate decarboxylase